MAKPLSSRRRKAADAWAEPPDEERQQQHNSKARADTIRNAVRYIADKQAEIKALREDLNEYKQRHVKGDLGFKIADFNAVLRVSQLEVEDRDKLLDTLGEGFRALGIGGQLDWVAAERGEAQPDTAPDPDAAERHAAEVSNGAEPAVPPKRGRGRPRKPTQQPELSIVEGTGGDAAA